MPYLTKYPVAALWPNEIVHSLSFTVPAGGGTPTAQILPPGDSLVSSGSGVYTFTLVDAPYYQCVGASVSFYQATSDANLAAKVSKPTNGSGTTGTVTFYAVTTGTAAEPTSSCDVSVRLVFRQTAVP